MICKNDVHSYETSVNVQWFENVLEYLFLYCETWFTIYCKMSIKMW